MPHPQKEQARQSLEQYLSLQGINPSKPFRCLSPDHDDQNPSMSFNRKNHRVHCFACGATYDIFDLIALEYSIDTFPKQLEKAITLLGLSPLPTKKKTSPAPTPLDIPQYTHRVTKNLPQTDYPALRGLSPATLAHFGIGFDPSFTQGTYRPWKALIIPTGPDTFTARNTDLHATKENRVRKVGGAPLFNLEALEGTAPAFIVEGEIDAMSLYEAGANAVALGGVAGVNRLLQCLKERPPAAGVILCLDSDESGQKACAALAEGLTGLGIVHSVAALPVDAKDPNEALTRDPEGFRAWVGGTLEMHGMQAEAEKEAAREAYERLSAQSHVQAFVNGIAEGVNTPCIPTGFASLDQALDGGLYEGLYIIGAITSLGKTTFALQMADQIAEAGQDVLIFSLEMARSELMAKSISRQSLAHCLQEGLSTKLAKTSRGITDGRRYRGYGPAEKQLIEDAVRRYYDIASRIYVHEGIGDIGVQQVREVVRQHTEVTGRRPVVLIDYLQIMAPHDVRATDKQNTDKAVLELKRISRDFKLPVIGISSFNRENYKNAVSMVAFKESGAIEYSSDVLIGLQMKGAGEASFDAEEAKKKDPREIVLKVLKNRNGAVGAAIEYAYYPMFNFFKEEKGKKA